VAERLRKQVCRRNLLAEFNGDGPVTISCGVVGYLEGESLDHLMMRVDAALYESKKRGKDQTVSLPAVTATSASGAV
jgi:PleD family two-component response regulator